MLLGGYLLYELVDILTHYPSYVGLSGPRPTWWFTTAVSLWLLSIAIEVRGAWGRRVAGTGLGLAAEAHPAEGLRRPR